jgi:hypothetical protein
MCVDLYQQGKWPDTPAGVKEKTLHDMIRMWVRQEEKIHSKPCKSLGESAQCGSFA